MIDSDDILSLAAISLTGFAVMVGPFMLAVRAALRLIVGVRNTKRWQKPAALGLRSGAVMATVLCAAMFGPAAAVFVTVLILLTLLAGLDLAWRWLPFEWTLPLLGLGLLTAAIDYGLIEALIGAAVGAGMLFSLKLYFRFVRGVDALGTGDIWLAAGLGTLSGMPVILYLLTLAAITGILSAAIAGFWSVRERYGVAFGAHLSLAYLIFLIF